MRLSRFALIAIAILIAANAFATSDVFLQIPGVTGGSTARGRAGWSDVQQHSLNLLPAVQDDKKKTYSSQCSAIIGVLLGAGAPATAELVGSPISSDVLIEAEHAETGQTFYRAALKGAVITRDSLTQTDAFRSELTISFTKIVLTIWPQKADGTLDTPQTGILDCLAARP